MIKKYMTLIMVIVFGLSFGAVLVQNANGQTYKVQTEMVTYDRENGVQGYLAKPDGRGSYPGLILIHEWWGLNDNIREFARSFAELGYGALAVDLYNGRSAKTPAEARTLATEVRNNLPAAFKNLTRAVEYLKNSPNVDGDRLASVGWCFGGGWSYEMARNDMGVRASVMYYGRFSPDDDFSMMRALILGNFGEEDRSISVDTVKEFQATLKTLNGDHEIYIYPNAGHAFANRDSESYNAEAADLAWKRTLIFLKKNL